MNWSDAKSKKWELFVLILAFVLAAVLFRNSDLDLWAARHFYHPENPQDPWSEQNQFWWEFFYRGAPWLTGTLLLGSFVVLLMVPWRPQWRKHQISAIFVFVVVALGPGLVINSFFKPSWGRPRPREVIELGGTHPYRSFANPDWGGPGKSFPCGHCSVGFAFGSLWWIFRRRSPVAAGAALMGSVGLGIVMGVGRIAAGGHFFSDVVFAGLISYSVCWFSYYILLKIPERNVTAEKPAVPGRRWIRVLGLGFLFVATVAALLLASPFRREVDLQAQPEANEDLLLRVDAGQLLVTVQEAGPAFVIQGEAKGFGFPGNSLKQSCEHHAKLWTCEIHRTGFFSDFESVMRVQLQKTSWHSVRIELKKGEASVVKGEWPSDWTMTLPQ